jgi:hypothetical protein
MGRERDNIERKKFLEEQRLAEHQRLAPVRVAEAALTKTHRQLLTAEREAALNGTCDYDTAVSLLSEAMKTITPERAVTDEQARTFNETEAIRFAESTSDYYACPENADIIMGYCARNGINVADAQTYSNVFRHLDRLGLMQHQAQSQPEPEVEQQPKPAQPQIVIGRDLVTGAPREWHIRELDHLSADEYRRALDLPTKQFVEYQENGTRW